MIEYKYAIRSLKNNNIQQIYYLKGRDQFLQRFFIDNLSKVIFNSDTIDKTLLIPNELSGKEIMDKMLSIDLFSKSKLFIIRDPQQLKGKVFKEIIEFCSKPIENHYLVLVNDNFMDNSVFSKSINKIVEPINVSTPLDNELIKWINYFFKENNKNVDRDIIMKIIEFYGDSVFKIKNEVDKLCLINNNDIINMDDLEAFSSLKRTRQRWELIFSIANRDFKKATILSKIIVGDNESMISLIFPLTSLFQEMLFVKINNGTFNRSNSYIPLSNTIKNNMLKFSNNYSYKRIIKALKKLKEIEISQKTEYSDDKADIIHFIYHVVK